MEKIVFIINTLGSGGAERVTITISEYYATIGYDVKLIIYKRGQNEYKIDNRIPLYYVPENNNNNKLKDIIEKRNYIKRILKEISPDYIISLGVYRHIFFSGIYKKYRCIFSERNDPSRVGIFDRLVKKICFSHSYKMVFQTKEAMDYYSKKIRDKGVLIQNPLMDSLPSRYEGKREKRIVTCCRLEKQKNIPLLLEAFKLFLAEHPGYKLEIYGEGSLYDSLFQYCSSLGLEEYVSFEGFVNPIHERIIKAAMYVSSSDYEGISNSMLEALAIGLPVVCTDCPVGGARMFVKDGINGKLVPVNNPNKLSNAMSFVVQSDEMNRRLSENAISINNELNKDAICRKWVNIITV